MPTQTLKPINQTVLLMMGCMALLGGLALARRTASHDLVLPLVGGGLAIYFFPKRNILSAILIILFGLSLGLWRGSIYMARLSEYQRLLRKPIVVTAIADNDAIYGRQSQLSFDATHVIVQSPRQPLAGKVKVEGIGVPMVYRGDHLQITGSLGPTKGSAQARFSFAKLRVTSHGHSFLDDFRRRFIAGLQSSLPEPEASFGAGILIGQRSTIPKDINDQLSITGLTHLVAVSGYNLTIIIVAVRQILGKGSKFQSTVAAAGLMLLFVLVTGLSASIVRAALVSSASLVAWYYGRRIKPLLLITLAAALTALWNPFYLWSDIGWYLSFLAFFGVLLVAPLVVGLMARGKKPKTIGLLLGETISAQLLTLPIIMYIFGRVSIIGLVANLLVVPLVPLAMLLSLAAGLGGALLTPLGGWIAWPARLLLTYMVDVTGLMSRMPHAAAQHTISARTMLVAYGLICLIALILRYVLARRGYLNMVE